MTPIATDDDLALIAALRQSLLFTQEPIGHYTPAEARAIVRANGVSYELISRVLRCSVQSVGGWLRGEHRPSGEYVGAFQRLIALLHTRANVLGVRLDEGEDA